jgi:hypothetical protein
MRPARLWDRKTNLVLNAEVLADVTPEKLVAVEKTWHKYREEAKARRVQSGLAVPGHNHWRWDEKAQELKFTAYRCLAVQHEGEVQGLSMVSTLAVPGQAAVHKGKPVLYVKYIETAPWNLRDYVGDDARFGGVGSSLIVAAIEVSIEEEFRGRIALHSLPQSEQFYKKFMENLGIDKDVEGLRYFELSEEQAHNFMKGGKA